LFLLFIIKEKISQLDASSAQTEKESPVDYSRVDAVLMDLQGILGRELLEKNRADFEWRYRENEDLRSLYVAGESMSFNDTLSSIMSLKNYFKDAGYLLDANNNIKGDGNGLLGYYKDAIVCLVTYESDTENNQSLYTDENALLFAVSVNCGYLSEQDSIRVSPAEESEVETSEEYEAMSIVRSQLAKLPEFIERQGGEIEIVNIKKLDCPGCWQLETSFEIVDPDDLEKMLKLDGFVYLNDWIMASSTIEFPAKRLESIESCTQIGGVVASSTPLSSCPENGTILGKIINESHPLLCCQPEKAE
jgi:hypothetical protein